MMRELVDGVRHEKGRYAVTLLAFLALATLCFLALPGCSGLPQDGNVGISWCGPNSPSGIHRCPCGYELRLSSHGAECIEIGVGALTEVPDGD